MSPRHPVLMVARREFVTRMLTKSNIISLAVMMVIIIAGALVLNYVVTRDEDGPGPQAAVALAEDAAPLGPHLERAAAEQGLDLELTTAPTAEAEALLTADDASIDAVVSGDPSSPELLATEEPDGAVLGVVDAAVRSYVITVEVTDLGGDPEAFERAVTTAAVTVRTLEDGPDAFGPAYLISMVMTALLLFALIGSGSIIAMGVVEEKTSRVVEILLATIKPGQLLTGKIVGIGLYGLFQVALLGGTVVVMLTGLGLAADIEVDVGGTLALVILWFLLGYAIFALLFGGFAALVSRQEEIGSVTTPLMFLLFVPFYVTIFMIPENPESTVATVLTQVPIFAPFMVPVRNAFGAIAGWEIALSIGIAVVTIPLLVWIAARVYQRGVLHTGGRMKLGEALRG